MRGYMDYIEESFLDQCGWDVQSSYANVILSSRNILDFAVPTGMSVHLTSQPTPPSVTTWTLNNLEGVQGSLAYMYSAPNVQIDPSRDINLEKLVQCYKRVSPAPVAIVNDGPSETCSSSKRVSKTGNLLYGRMFLPSQAVEAMAIRSISPYTQCVAKWVCDPRLVQPVVATATLQQTSKDRSTTREFIYSTHENLLGFRTLSTIAEWDREGDANFHSRLAAGMELFYAASKKSPGLSIASRYSTHSRYTGTPLTLTLVSNPLMGSVSVAYALKPTQYSAFSSRFDFNFYSYGSDLTIGCELWRSEPISGKATVQPHKRDAMSVFKASTSLATQTARIVWEGSYRAFLVSTGAAVCYGDRARPLQLGVEFVYAS